MKRIIFCAIALMALLGILHFASARERGLSYHEVQFVDETGAPVTDITGINIYAPDSTTNATIYMDPGLQNAITQQITTGSTNTTFTQSTGTLYWWGPDGYDFTFTNGTNIATNAGHRTRTSSEGRLYFPSYLTNITSADYEDGESVSYGSDDDFIVNGGTTANLLTFTPITNGTSKISLGTTGACCDVNFFGDTALYDLMWDATDNRLEFSDNAILSVGTGIDWYITHNGTTTTATGALTHASAATFSTDVTLTGNAYNVEWDNSSDTLHLLDSAELGIGGATTADGDVVFKHDGTDFTLTTIRADEPWDIGGTTYGFDITYAFETAGTFSTDFDGDIIGLTDDMLFGFGGSLAAPDVSIEWDTAGTDALLIEGATADTEVKLGYTTNMNLGIYGTTNTNYVLFDTDGTASRVDFEGFDLRVKDDDILEFGDSAEVSMNYDEDGDNDLQVKGPVDFETTYCLFGSNPVCMTITGADGDNAGGTTGDENAMIIDGTNFEYHILGTGQTITVPAQTANGLDVRLDATDNEGMEMGEGITASSKSSFTTNTDAFYLKVKFYLTDVNDFDIMAIGFRLAAAYNADLYAYDTYAGINVNNGTINGIDELNGGSAHETDMVEIWTDGTAHTLEVRISATGAVTQYLDGTAVDTPLVFDWSDNDTVVPFFHILGDASAAGEVAIQLWECGLQ